MTEKLALTYVEIDIEVCSLTYGELPCRANLAGEFTADFAAEFDDDNNGFTATGATLTAAAGGSVFAPTGADAQLIKTGLEIDGARQTVVRIDYERKTARTGGAGWQGALTYSIDGGHGFSGSYYQVFGDLAVGQRAVAFLDMASLAVGGTDWISHTITGLRFDFDNGSGSGQFIIHSIDVGSRGAATVKCFNSKKTCQDVVRYDAETVTLRFAKPADYLPASIECIPSIIGVDFTPGTVSLGKDLGERATLSVSFEDHRWSDTGPGYDPYLADRTYDPFTQGTYWGKFRARQPFLRGKSIRLIQGFLGDDLADMDTRHYVIDSFDGPTPDGKFTITAKDVLKLADGDRAQAPRLSNGFLVAAIDEDDVTATLSPSGIGNQEYPASGHVAIGGKEVCAFTRSGDALTLTRAQFGTEAAEHDAQDRVQLCIYYEAEDSADIIADLFQTYADVPSSYIPLASWRNETVNFNRRLYTALIAEPTPVKDLVSELIEQAALAVWWDDEDQEIHLQVLRQIPTTAATWGDENILEGTLRTREQPNTRISQAWVYFGQRNPLERQDDPDNYRSVAATVDLERETDYGTPAIKKIFSRWIPAFGRTVATRLGAIQLGRFSDPPRRFSFAIFRDALSVVLGGGYKLEGWSLQDATGARETVPIQVTRLNPQDDRFEVEAEEMLFTQRAEAGGGGDDDNRVIIIDSNVNNINLRSVYDTLYPTPASGDEVACIIETGVIVGSSSPALPAFDVGSWPSGVEITLTVAGRIQGAGGRGGGGTPGQNGQAGGVALYTRYAIDVEVADGEIFGGGGGGGAGATTIAIFLPVFGGGGGGGSGQLPGQGGPGVSESGDAQPTDPGQAGTTEAGGSGGGGAGLHNAGGAGGNPGQSGATGAGGGAGILPAGTGGAAGAAIDGVSFVTITVGPGDVRGPTIN